MIKKLMKATLLALVLCFVISPVAAKEKAKLPETTKDGLQLQKHTKLGAVYLAPGASLADYDKVKILDCYVAFEKNWQRNFNRESMDLANRVSDKDVETIKNKLAAEFPKIFTKELEKGGYQVVDTTGKDVLLLRPAIINLTLTSTDINKVGIGTTIVGSNGSMTLYAELYDSLTSAKIAEVMDAEEVGDNGFAHQGGRWSNQVEFDRTLRAWAEILRKRLDEAHGK